LTEPTAYEIGKTYLDELDTKELELFQKIIADILKERARES
jgi:hypothetical protein